MSGCSEDPEISVLGKQTFENTCTFGDGCTIDGAILLREGLAANQYREVLGHEIAHWLLMCSGVEPSGDPEHSILKVWGNYIPGKVAATGLAGEIR
jgi:hypothetical protein